MSATISEKKGWVISLEELERNSTEFDGRLDAQSGNNHLIRILPAIPSSIALLLQNY
jgi:hypothetical protein